MKSARVVQAFALGVVLAAMIGCGSAGSAAFDESTPALVTPSAELGELTATEKLVFTESYAGYLVVHFDEGLRKGIGEKSVTPTSVLPPQGGGEIIVPSGVDAILAERPSAALKRSVDTAPEKLDARRAELEMLSGKKLADFNSIYHIEVADPDEAVRLMRELASIDGVKKIYPGQKLYLTGIETTPSLTGHQDYLYPESTHGGLNAQAAWGVGVYGQGVMLVDAEEGWNIDHLDLPLAGRPDINMGAVACTPADADFSCQSAVSHGTAVTGILSAIDNSHGVTGFAPSSDMYVAGITPAMLIRLTDGDESNRELAPGSVFLIEVGIAGALNPNGNCGSNQYGCLPLEAFSSTFDSIEYAAAAGITVVSAAGNGEIDLADPNAYYANQMNLGLNDSGSIIVAASQGSNKQKASFSNFGAPVDAFAWGEGVVTTGYLCNAPGWNCEAYSQWLGATPPIPPNTDPNAYFIDSFGGTSASAPMVAGAAALVQSYAKQQMGQTRYLMPLKMREILVNSGVSQVGGGGFIGKQPRVDVAMGLVDQAWNAWSVQYPELGGSGTLTQAEMIALRQSGLGIICKANDPANSDPTCPDDSMWVPGSGIAETLDFDADGRADLVSWKNGQFKIDLSSTGPDADGFGAWDIFINYPAMNAIVWPYVEDMNSDGREDFLLYDKTNGTWYIAYTTSAILGGAGFQGWDEIITTSVHDVMAMNPLDPPYTQVQYCRPHPGDYDGDGWIDLAVACSDGVWYIAHSNAGAWNASITYDQQVQYLTPQQLSEAPGWAYLTGTTKFHSTISDTTNDMLLKIPDGITNEGNVTVMPGPSFLGNTIAGAPAIFGGNNFIMLPGKYTYAGYYSSIGVKDNVGQWPIADPDFWTPLTNIYPSDIFGGLSCHPIVADFDGDNLDDRVVMCPTEWKIAYSSDTFSQLKSSGVRHVTLNYDMKSFSLPGRSYSGNVPYAMARELIQLFKDMNPTQPPPIPVDMVTISICELSGDGTCQ